MDAQFASRRQGSLVIVEEDHLCWLHAKALTGQFINASIRLGNSYLVGVNDEIGYLIKTVALLLSGPGTNKAITDDSSLIARTQAAEVGGQFHIECTQILFPEVVQKGVDLRLVHSNDLFQALLHLLFRTFSQGAISPYTCHPLIQLPWFQMEALLPLFRHSGVRRDFQYSTDIKSNRSNSHTCHSLHKQVITDQRTGTRAYTEYTLLLDPCHQNMQVFFDPQNQ